MHFDTLEEQHIFGKEEYRICRVRDLDKLVDEVDDALFNEDERLPYWAELWPAAIGLSRFISTHKNLIDQKTVLELGCGLGLTTLVLARQNPARLLATDYEQDALDFAAENFKLNQITLPEFRLLDWRNPDLDQPFDCIVASDVLYEKRFFKPLLIIFKTLLAHKGQILLAEPSRPIAHDFFELLFSHNFLSEKTDESVLQDGKAIKVSIHNIQKKTY